MTIPTGFQIRAARALVGASQNDLAALASVSERSVREWEATNGPIRIRRVTAERLTAALVAFGVELIHEPTPGVRLTDSAS